MLVSCLHCNKEFEKSNSDIKKSPNNYCSRSCAAKRNNKKPKRQRTNRCECGVLILSDRKRCSHCHQKSILPKDCTLGEASYDYGHNAYAKVRQRARTVAKRQGWTSCCKCGYDKHIEIAHIKAISNFPSDTPLTEINCPSNLMPLCPNCHWEFDHPEWPYGELNSGC